jgi:hypothetical protein
VLLNDGVWQVKPILTGDYNRDETVNAADYVMWRKTQGTTVTPSTGADGNGNGVVDQDDYGEWREHFGQTASPPGAGSAESAAAESNLLSLQVSEVKQAVEVRGVSEQQQKGTSIKESAFAELAAPSAASIVNSGPKVRLWLGGRPAQEVSRCDDALLMLPSQTNSKKVVAEGANANELDDEEANNAYELILDSVAEAFASHLLIPG